MVVLRARNTVFLCNRTFFKRFGFMSTSTRFFFLLKFVSDKRVKDHDENIQILSCDVRRVTDKMIRA